VKHSCLCCERCWCGLEQYRAHGLLCVWLLCLQVREVRCHYSTATGPCAARSRAQQLWAGEDYVLQVDAHMRFVQVSKMAQTAHGTKGSGWGVCMRKIVACIVCGEGG